MKYRHTLFYMNVKLKKIKCNVFKMNCIRFYIIRNFSNLKFHVFLGGEGGGAKNSYKILTCDYKDSSTLCIHLLLIHSMI